MDESQTSLNRILDAAAEAFAVHGYAGAKVDRIAQAAGVNKAALYYYVGNKEKLFETVLTSRFNEAGRQLAEALSPEASPEEDMRRFVFALAEIFETNPVLPRLMIQEIVGGGAHLTPPIIERIMLMIGQTGRILERGRAAGVFRPADPFLTHLAIIAPLAMFVLARPVREHASVEKLPQAIHFGQSVRDMAAHLADTVVLALKPMESRGTS